MDIVGLVHLLDRDGGVMATALYDYPLVIRERQLVVGNIRFEQASSGTDAKTGKRVHRYRMLEKVHPQPDTEGLKDIQYITTAETTPVTWEDVGKWFAQYRDTTEPVPISRIRDLESLIQGARASQVLAPVVAPAIDPEVIP